MEEIGELEEREGIMGETRDLWERQRIVKRQGIVGENGEFWERQRIVEKGKEVWKTVENFSNDRKL